MVAAVSCAPLMGIDAFTVQLEVDFSRSGMPAFTKSMFQSPRKTVWHALTMAMIQAMRVLH